MEIFTNFIIFFRTSRVYMCMYLIIAPVAQIIVVLSTQTGLVTSHVNQTAFLLTAVAISLIFP